MLINQDAEAKAKALDQFEKRAAEKFGSHVVGESLRAKLALALENEDEELLRTVLNIVVFG